MRLDSNASITFTASSCYINKELLYAITDPDGFEYNTTIFQMAVS